MEVAIQATNDRAIRPANERLRYARTVLRNCLNGRLEDEDAKWKHYDRLVERVKVPPALQESLRALLQRPDPIQSLPKPAEPAADLETQRSMIAEARLAVKRSKASREVGRP